MRRVLTFWLLTCAAVAAQVIPPPAVDQMQSSPFAIKKTWIIGGAGAWDYLTMDPAANQLLIAHGPVVQVVDVETGTVAGTVAGFREAHSIALDSSGEVGYVSDGPAGRIRIFDRRSFQIVASIATAPNPRALVFEPQTGLLLAVSPGAAAAKTASARTGAEVKSTITVIDTQTREALANIVLSGKLGFAQADGKGRVYLTVEDFNGIARLDVAALGSLLHNMTERSDPAQKPLALDWTGDLHTLRSADRPLRFFPLGQDCREPRSIAIDGSHLRLFAACNNMQMAVLNTGTGDLVTSVRIGGGVDAIGYDAGRGLIFTANGYGYGSLTVIRQDVNDSYAVVQNLPTRQQTRTLAINSSTGEVYLVTALYGAKIGNPPADGIGTLDLTPIDGSFQVLVVAR